MLLVAGLGPFGAIVVINLLPGVASWERGLLTGVAITAYLWVLAWSAWVSSGSAYRIQGALAEDQSRELFARLPGCRGVVSSYKWDGRDIDHIVVLPRFVLAAETKWTAQPVTSDRLRAAAWEAERCASRLRRELASRHEPIKPSEVFPCVVFSGPTTPDDLDELIQGDLEPVRVMSGAVAKRRLSAAASGRIGADYGAELCQRLNTIAVERDKRNAPSSRLIRFLARTT